MITTQEFAVAI